MIKSFMGRPVVLIGMHRSGTTLLSKFLDEVGYYSGWQKEENNESKYFIKLNDKILNFAGANWECPFNVETYFKENNLDYLAEYLFSELNKLGVIEYLGLKNIYDGANIFNSIQKLAIKDPRFSVTFPVWKKIFPNMQVLHIKRHGVDVANSLYQRSKKLYQHKSFGIVKPYGLRVLEIQYGLELWNFYENKCLEALECSNSISIKYEELLEKPKENLSLLTEFLDVNVTHEVMNNYVNSFNPERSFSYRKTKHLIEFAEKNKRLLAGHGY